MNILIVLAFLILALGSYSDIRTKEISIAIPLLLACAGGAYSYMTGVSCTAFLLSLVLLTPVSLLGRQRIGLGDVFTVSALALFCGGSGLILMISTAVTCAALFAASKKLLCKSADINEIAMLPFISIGFAAAMV